MQNKGDTVGMATAIENFPNHCFNIHNNCGSWCNFKGNSENYKHSVIGNGFRDQKLFYDLKYICHSLAKKISSFAAGTSSNNNENLNAMIVSKAPKNRVYGMSSAGDIRVACAISKNNLGENYLLSVSRQLQLSPGKYTKKHCVKSDDSTKNKDSQNL